MTLEQEFERDDVKHRARFIAGFAGALLIGCIIGLVSWLGMWFVIIPFMLAGVYWLGKYIIKAIDYFMERHERRKKEQKNGNTK